MPRTINGSRILISALCLLISVGCGKKDNPVPPETDTTPPRVIHAYPADSAVGLPRNTAIYVMFSEPMQQSTAQAAFSASGASGTFFWFGNNMVFVPSSPFPADDTVRLSVSSNAQDLADNGLAPAFSRWFVTGSTLDDVRPTVTALSPAAGASGVAVGQSITMRTSEPILQFISGQVGLRDSLGALVPGNTSWQDSVTVVFNPGTNLANDMRYTVTVDTILRDRSWNRNEAASWQFTTEADNTPPTVVVVSPANGSLAVSFRDSVVITFSEPMDTASVRAAFVISPAASGHFSWSGTTTIKFKPSQILAVKKAYTVTVGTGARDRNGNQMAAPFSASFTTDGAIYAACASANKVYVLARTSGDEMQQISATGPVDVACSPDGSKLYVVTGGASGSLLVLDPNNAHVVLRTIPLGSQPYVLAVSPSGRHLAVSNYGSNSLSIIDTVGWTANHFGVENGPRGLDFGNSNNIIVVCAGSGYLYSYPLSGGTWQYRSSSSVSSNSEGLALSGNRDTVYLCEGSQLSAFAAATDFPWAGGAVTGCYEVLRKDSLLYASDPLGNRVRVYRATPSGGFLIWKTDIAVGSMPQGLGLSSDGARLYSANSSGGTITEMNPANNTVVRTLTVGAGARAVALSP